MSVHNHIISLDIPKRKKNTWNLLPRLYCNKVPRYGSPFGPGISENGFAFSYSTSALVDDSWTSIAFRVDLFWLKIFWMSLIFDWAFREHKERTVSIVFCPLLMKGVCYIWASVSGNLCSDKTLGASRFQSSFCVCRAISRFGGVRVQRFVVSAGQIRSLHCLFLFSNIYYNNINNLYSFFAKCYGNVILLHQQKDFRWLVWQVNAVEISQIAWTSRVWSSFIVLEISRGSPAKIRCFNSAEKDIELKNHQPENVCSFSAC